MAEEKYNLKNPAVKRILQEVKEMQSNPSEDFMSLPLEQLLADYGLANAMGQCLEERNVIGDMTGFPDVEHLVWLSF